jgi:hypothetical protein
MRRNRYAYLEALRRPQDTQDYSAGGEVERVVLAFLKENDEWWMRSRIAYALEVDINRLLTVLNRLLWRRAVRMRVDELGNTLWRGV